MVLDIDLFRDEKSGPGSADKIKQNQKKRFKDEALVDAVTNADSDWRKGEVNFFTKEYNILFAFTISTAVG